MLVIPTREEFVNYVESKAKANKVSIKELCRHAGLNANSFYYWKCQKRRPSLKSAREVCIALEELIISRGNNVLR